VQLLRPTHHETFNVLKTNGYNLEHNFGHGKRHLATILAILNLLAFACHTVCELGDRAWRAARRELVTRQGFFQSLRTIATYLVFQSWNDLLETLAFTRPPTAWTKKIPQKMSSQREGAMWLVKMRTALGLTGSNRTKQITTMKADDSKAARW